MTFVECYMDLTAHEARRVACVMDAGVELDIEGEADAWARLYADLSPEQEALRAALPSMLATTA